MPQPLNHRIILFLLAMMVPRIRWTVWCRWVCIECIYMFATWRRIESLSMQSIMRWVSPKRLLKWHTRELIWYRIRRTGERKRTQQHDESVEFWTQMCVEFLFLCSSVGVFVCLCILFGLVTVFGLFFFFSICFYLFYFLVIVSVFVFVTLVPILSIWTQRGMRI